MRPTDLFPGIMISELLRCHRANPNWVETVTKDGLHYTMKVNVDSWLTSFWKKAVDGFAMLAASAWLGNGPKVFQPTAQQCRAMEEIDVNITLTEHSQPYPAILIELPAKAYLPFSSVMCHRSERLLTCVLHTPRDAREIAKNIERLGVEKGIEASLGYEIATAITDRTGSLEKSIRIFNDDCKEEALTATKAFRVGINSCLALSHFGCHADLLFPKEVEQDRSLLSSKKHSDGAKAKARERLKVAPMVVKFDQEVILHRTERGADKSPEFSGLTGRESPAHWRRGHWASQPCGKMIVGEDGRRKWTEQRKVVLRPAVLVRADRIGKDQRELISTTYVAR